ncbi:GmrSD restriction endonuclease domain-containing protein [Bradyrhizobium betae]|uniref:GmrSD restriction endonuclease domain-containing protein n=1 Tax=Bradyrhizobium betae TaxID=244734 RepID=UPI003D672D40
MQDFEDLHLDDSSDLDQEAIGVQPDKRTIHAKPGDVEVDSLYNKQKRGKLLVQPDFQRDFVWDVKRASRLIESALLQIPIPTIYISEEPDGREYVIDGQQRLTAFFSFLDGNFPDGSKFTLTGLKVYPELNGKAYDALDEKLQDAIRYYLLRTVTFKKGSDENLKFEIFERLNTGSVPLNDQELRNCIYRGRFNSLTQEMSEDPDFVYLLDIAKPDSRMRDIELVLRFCAFYHATYLNYKPPMKSFLNKEAETFRDISASDERELRAAFKNSCQINRSLFGKHAFKRYYRGNEKSPNGYWETKKFNASLYDVLMYTFAKEDKNKVFQNLDSIREALISLMTTNEHFIGAIELSTSSVKAITTRFDIWRIALQAILGIQQKEPRCFSSQLKEALFTSDPTCAICNNRIQQVDDAAVDHIEQYWTGGKTIPQNARLTHRYCNWARPRKE